MKRINTIVLVILAMLLTISSVWSLYESTEDVSGDGAVDAWYADTDDNMRYDRWNYDVNADARAEYYQYDLNGNCYAEYTNRVYVDTATLQYQTWAADTNGDGIDDRVNYDTNGDGAADIYMYDNDFDGIFEEVFVDTDYDFSAGVGFDEWHFDTDADGTIDRCRYDIDGDDIYTPGTDTEINAPGCYSGKPLPGIDGATVQDVNKVNHWYYDSNENGNYDRKNYDSNLDGLADVYTYDRDHNGIFEEIKIDSDFSYLIPNPNNESFDEWYWDTNQDGIVDLCWYDVDGDNNFSYAVDNWVNATGCYNYTFIIPVTTNVVYNRWNWPCAYNLSNGVAVSSLLSPRTGMMVTHFNTENGELYPVKAGTTAVFRVSLFNNGDIDFATTRFTMSVPELAIRAPRQIIYDFTADDTEGLLFEIHIPEDAEDGEYGVRFHALTNEGEERTEHRILIIESGE
jgi:hypothetical protein